LSGTHWIAVLLALVAVALGAQLLLSDDRYRRTRTLRLAVASQQQENEELRERNAELDAEVVNLKGGLEAAEERARTDLGFIGEQETFYQVVPASLE